MTINFFYDLMIDFDINFGTAIIVMFGMVVFNDLWKEIYCVRSKVVMVSSLATC